ncbi:protein of unknown function [Aureimonas phyllosphaerae]|nr:protein of unknown function [Aureimonas phyllosphaerae]
MAGVNPNILSWARETAGLDRESAARKIDLKAARGRSGAERLAALEAGEEQPSAPLLQRMAHGYRRPLLTFYAAEVPAPAELGQDFRTLPEEGDPSNVLLAALLRDVKARQGVVRDLLEDDEDAERVGLVGAQRGNRNASQIADALQRAIGFERMVFRARRTAEEAFAYLRRLVEAKGVFVLLAGDCGHHSTAIDVRVFRGFAIADPLAPFIVINDQDAKSAWSFTLLHELAHLLLGESGISGGPPQGAVEQLCNDTAAAVLIVPAEILNVPIVGTDADVVEIGVLADQARVSRAMVAYQLLRAERIPAVRWEALRDRFQAERIANRARERDERQGRTGPNWYTVRRHRLGDALLSVARRGMTEGTLTPTRAARMLGVKPMSVYPLLAEPKRANA